MSRGAAVSTTPLLLMTPGPSRVPERVLRAGSVPMMYHRSQEFSKVLASVLERLQPLFGTRSPVLPVHATGRGAMEAALCNLFSPGDEIVMCCNGRFGEMWADLAASYRLVVHRVATDWTREVDPREVERELAIHPAARAVGMTHCDTSTGMRNDVRRVAAVARARGTLMLVNAMATLGGMPFEMDEWGIDVAVAGSQKCLMSSPGLAFVSLSDAAWPSVGRARLPRNYWDLPAIKRLVTRPRPEVPGTPPVAVVLQLAESLTMIQEEGLHQVFERHEAMAALTRRRAGALGLSLQCPGLARFAPTVTAFSLPLSLPPKVVRDGLRARGIVTAGGVGRFQVEGFRIGHMGDIRLPDVERTMDALATVLADQVVVAPARESGSRR